MKPAFEFWIVAGPNGAGKTTCVQAEPIRTLIPNVRFLNPDDRTRQLLSAQGYSGFAGVPDVLLVDTFIRAAREVEADILGAIRNRQSVGVETVLSTDKYRPLVEQTIASGGSFHLLYVSLKSPSIAKERVALRVTRGGHDVPPDKVEERFQRSYSKLAWFASKAKNFWVIDNSDSNPNTKPYFNAYGTEGRLEFLHPDSPQFLKDALSPLPLA